MLFGGYDGLGGNPGFADTWDWDGATWTQRTSASAPSGRYDTSLVPDPTGGGTLLISGRSGGTVFGDLWRWDGTAWSRLLGAAAPQRRHSYAMAHDSAAGTSVYESENFFI